MMEDKAYKYARNLLFEICRRDCPEKEVEALDDTIGVLTQIDHMTAHLFSRIEALIAERDAARDAALEEAAKVAGVDALVQAAEFILDGMGIDAPGYEIDPDDDFLDAANSAWVKDTIARLSAAIRALKGKSQ